MSYKISHWYKCLMLVQRNKHFANICHSSCISSFASMIIYKKSISSMFISSETTGNETTENRDLNVVPNLCHRLPLFTIHTHNMLKKLQISCNKTWFYTLWIYVPLLSRLYSVYSYIAHYFTENVAEINRMINLICTILFPVWSPSLPRANITWWQDAWQIIP